MITKTELLLYCDNNVPSMLQLVYSMSKTGKFLML